MFESKPRCEYSRASRFDWLTFAYFSDKDTATETAKPPPSDDKEAKKEKGKHQKEKT